MRASLHPLTACKSQLTVLYHRDLVLDATHLLHGTRTSVLRACNNYAAIANLSCLVPQARFAYMLGKTKEDGPYQDWSHRDSPISGSLRCSSWMGRVEGPAPAWAKDEEAALDQIVDLICNPYVPFSCGRLTASLTLSFLSQLPPLRRVHPARGSPARQAASRPS